MPPNTPPPPQRAEPFTLVLKGLKVVVPPAGIVAIAVLLTPGLAYMVIPGGTATTLEHGPIPAPVPQVPLQGWTTDVRMSLLPVVSGALGWPSGPLDGQITTASQCKWPNQMRRGACWIQVGNVKPPCKSPNGDAPLYEDAGACWAPVLRAARSPTTGDPGTLPVAAPAD